MNTRVKIYGTGTVDTNEPMAKVHLHFLGGEFLSASFMAGRPITFEIESVASNHHLQGMVSFTKTLLAEQDGKDLLMKNWWAIPS